MNEWCTFIFEYNRNFFHLKIRSWAIEAATSLHMDEQHDAHSLKPMIRSMFSILTYDLLGNNDEEQDEVHAT